MKRYLITGFSGFVSKHFINYLSGLSEETEILGIDVQEPAWSTSAGSGLSCSFRKIDLLNREQLKNVLHEFQPDYILHLASYSSVAFSWKNPVLSFQNNTNIFLNLIDILRELKPAPRLLSIGSSEEYGNVAPEDVPLKEAHPLNPVSPYAVARISQEMLSRVYAEGYEIPIIMTRSFNHIGPGQREIFVVPSFAKQMIEQKKAGKNEAALTTGDTSIVRDFLDVRDVVRAYYLLLKGGKVGEVYNVCSGQGVTLKQVIEKMAELLVLKVTLKTDPALIRPNDNRVIIGSNEKIENAVGWSPEISFEQSLRDILSYWTGMV